MKPPIQTLIVSLDEKLKRNIKFISHTAALCTAGCITGLEQRHSALTHVTTPQFYLI